MVLKDHKYLRKLLLILLLNTLCNATGSKLKDNLALEILVEKQKNVVISPLMVRFPLCKLATVAQGEAKKDLLSILEMKPDEVPTCYTVFKKVARGLRNMDFLNLNNIIVNYTDDVNPQFLSNGTNYGVRVERLGFNFPNLAVSFVNRWVDKATYKRVSDILVPGDINNKTSILIINAAYLKVTWEFPFHIKSTKNKNFRHHTGKVSVVPMMSKIESCLYLNDDVTGSKFITMKLAGFGLTMTVILPPSIKGLPYLLRKLLNEPDYLSGVQKRMKYTIVKITLPRFKIKSGLELNEYLRKIGASIIFNDTYSGLNEILKEDIAVRKHMYVSKLKQNNFIDVDEMGIFRHLPRDIYDDRVGPFSGVKEVVFDHPFYFTVKVQADLSNSPHIYNMFQGVYYGPEE